MYMLLCILLNIQIVFCSINVTEEQTPVKKCVQNLINHLISPDHVVLYAYSKNNKFLPDMIQNPKITIDMEKKIFNTKNYEIFMQMIILDVMHLNVLGDYFIKMNKNNLVYNRASPRQRYLIIVRNTNIEELKYVFHYLFQREIIDVMIMTYNHYSNNTLIRLFKINPYNPANKCGKVIAALEKYTCDTIKTVRSPRILDKYGNCTLTYFISGPALLIKNLTERNYILDFLTNIITKTLNLTLSPTKFGTKTDSTFSIYLYNLRLCTDVLCSLPFYRVDWIWIVSSARQIDPLDVFKIIFKPVVWYSILLTFIITSIVWWVITKSTRASDFLLTVVDVYSATLFGYVNKLSSFFQVRILFISYVIYALPIQTAFTSSLVRLLTVPQFEPAFKTIEEIAYSELPVATLRDVVSFFEYKEKNGTIYSRIQNKLISVYPVDLKAKVNTINDHKNVTVFIPHYLIHNIYNGSPLCLEFFKDNSMTGPEFYTFFTNPMSLLLPSINKIIEILFETGQLNHEINLYREYVKGTILPPNQVSDENVVLTLNHVHPVFVFWGIGLIFATFIFFLELLIHHKCCKK